MNETISHRERELLRKLTTLAAERDEAETAIERDHKTRRSSTDRKIEEELTSLQARFEQDSKAAAAEHQTTLEETITGLAKKEKKAKKRYEARKFQIEEQADHDEAKIKKNWKDAKWTAETVYEAKENQPGDRFKKSAKSIRSKFKGLQSMRDQAAETLKTYRQPRKVTTSNLVDLTNEDSAEHMSDEPTRPVDPSTVVASTRSLDEIRTEAQANLTKIQRAWFARWWLGMRPFFVVLFMLAAAAASNGWLTEWKFNAYLLECGIGAGVATLAVLAIVYFFGRKQVMPPFARLHELAAEGHAAHDAAMNQTEQQREAEEAELKRQRDEDIAKADAEYAPKLKKVQQLRTQLQTELDEKYQLYQVELKQKREQLLNDIEERHAARVSDIETRHQSTTEKLDSEHGSSRTALETEYAEAWNQLETRWKTGMHEVHTNVEEIQNQIQPRFPAWDSPQWNDWQPPAEFAPAVRFGKFDINMQALPGGIPRDDRLMDVGPFEFSLPAVLDFPTRSSLLLEVGDHGREEATETLRNVMMRLLTSFPPGNVRFTIIDPVGLGQNFAGFMHLADYEESFVADRIWTETRHIEQRLIDLTEHMENVIQKYLRNDFDTITEYNKHAGEIAEPFRFLVIANFPVNFSDTAARRLVSIVDSGPRCGVYTLISMDTRQSMPQGFQPTDLRKGGVVIRNVDGEWKSQDAELEPLPLTLDDAPSPDFITKMLHVVGEAARDSTRVEVPFEHVTPSPSDYWTSKSDKEIRVPLGRAGATKLQHLEIGRGITQHALIAGKTGSGKSTLLHVLVTNLALRYRPDEVEFYLVDFKKGVEFKTYATHNLPHARAVAIESDREFGLSVLQRLDAELKRRGELFRELGVQDVAGYRETNHPDPVPRTLLIIDEFQELFVEDDKLSQDASLLLDRLVRQGRAFGIHVLLGSQTLGGAYSLARSTIGQMAVRIALQCNEADAMLIMGDDNTAARLLNRPGEALYNDQSGRLEGNSPFQIVWLPDHVREHHLQEIESLAREENYEMPEPQIVFEGNVPADPERNRPLRAAMSQPSVEVNPAPHMWLGDAIAIKDPTHAIFRRQSSANVLMVGQQDEAALAMQTMGIIGLAAQAPLDDSIIYIFDGQTADAPHAGYFENLARKLPHDLRIVSWQDVDGAMQELNDLFKERESVNRVDLPPVYCFVYGLQRFRMLRQEEDFSFGSSGGDADQPKPSDKIFGDILRDGPPLGLHTITWCDSVNNLNRSFDRKTLREFDMRVMFQMSGSDSSNLIDSPAASMLGQRRALFFSEDHGVLEKFRPYALPDDEQLQRLTEYLSAKVVDQS